METFLISLSILIISGLGFITYRHPKTGRQILSVLWVLAFLYYCSISIYYSGQSDGFRKSFDATQISLYKPIAQNIDYDSLKSIYKNNLDTLSIILQKHGENLSKDKMYLNQERQLTDSIYKSLLQAKSTTEKVNSSLSIYYYISLLIIIVFFVLSYIFQNLWHTNSVKQNYTPDKTT
jgi:hypothetical protein